MTRYIFTLRQSPRGWNDENRQLLDRLMSRQEHLMLDLLLPNHIKGWKKNPHTGGYAHVPVVILAECWKYLPDSARWVEEMLDNGQRTLEHVDQLGPIISSNRCLKCSYVLPLMAIVAPKPRDVHKFPWELSDVDAKRLRAMFDRMEKHRLRGMQSFGKLGHLWIDQRQGKLSEEESFQRAQDLFTFIKKAIAKPGVKKKLVNKERLACYEVMCGVINSIVLRGADRARLIDDLLQFMIDRKETTLGAVRLTTFFRGTNHLNYKQPAFYGPHYPWRLAWVGSKDRDKAKLQKMNLQLKTLLTKGKVRCLDNLRYDTKRALWSSMQGASGAESVPRIKPWTASKKLFDYDDVKGLKKISNVIARGRVAYVAGLIAGKPDRVHLYRLIPESGKKELCGAMDLEMSKELRDIVPTHGHRKGWPVRLAYDDGDSKAIFCATPQHGGIVVFPLDGSPPRRMLTSNVPGMPTNVIDHLLVVDNKLFGLTSEMDESPAFVHWYDPDDGGWNVIASSRRAEQKTPLDNDRFYRERAWYDARKNRILFIASHAGGKKDGGMYQFDIATRKITRIKHFPRFLPMWCDVVPKERFWIAWKNGYTTQGMGNLYELDLRTDSWREAARLAEGRKRFCIRDVTPARSVINRTWGVYPPAAEIDGWLWTFYPFSRVSFDGRTHELLEDPIGKRVPNPSLPGMYRSKTPFFRVLVPYWNTLLYLPECRGVIYGNLWELWYFQLPAEPDPPPIKKVKPLPRKRRPTPQPAAGKKVKSARLRQE